ncbi:hypothetical protein MFM001_24520 [Mycobacterium sp. MFM001]|uniref:hypothetical protein n=1 Tax=Mycobacterium sp. MFM001 TaxID=2049453 RepID=UPI000DA43F8F|nr:hypothetical protein [Mycobacterium sp. MFM001]GBE65990.1 hypothetical protein MFM001_24520 [Mycobacterium sp. MFM001]
MSRFVRRRGVGGVAPRRVAMGANDRKRLFWLVAAGLVVLALSSLNGLLWIVGVALLVAGLTALIRQPIGGNSLTGDWPGVSRDGEPELVRGPQPGSAKRPNEYQIRTTPVPAGAHGADWLGLFNSQLAGPPFTAYHDGNKIIVECRPDDEPTLVETVDAAIEHANERLRALYG